MEEEYALITDGKVVSVIVSNASFAGSLGYEYAVRVDNLDPKPGIGWDYDSGTNTFTDNRGA